MQLARPAIAQHPFRFGRGRVFKSVPLVAREWKLSDDLKLFAATFLAGFVFVSILIS